MPSRRNAPSHMHRGFTLAEVLTIVVALTVLVAVSVSMWRSHELSARRRDAMKALLALQTAQDQYFGEHARYADEVPLFGDPPAGLGIKPVSPLGFFRISAANSEDDLGYWATARATEPSADTRCVELRIDQNGRRFAVDSQGVDRSADCWR